VLDRIEGRRFLVQPARKHSLPKAVGALDVHLNEGAGELLELPRRGRLARAKPDDHVLGAHRLAGAHAQLANDAVALVQKAEHRDPLRHRRHARLVGWRPHRLCCGGLLRLGLCLPLPAPARRRA
jgi:hypothetical protein